MAKRPVRTLALAVSMATACAVETEDPEHERTAAARMPITVAEAGDAGCSTIAVKGLSLQIIAQSSCIEPGAFVAIPEQPNVSVQDTVFAFLEAPAQEAFVAAVSPRPDLTLTLNSALRTVAQQYLLYRWYQQGTCGIALAATPGNSNHETGLALDVSEYQTWRPILEAQGFSWLGSSDPVHFDYAGPGAVDYRGTDVLAFQMLWNLNHPDDPIDEDGAWGPQTQARMEQSPAEGFPIGASCGDAPDVWLASTLPNTFDRFADGLSAGVPDVFEADDLAWAIELENRGQAEGTGVKVAVELEAAIAGSAITVERAPARGAPAATTATVSFAGAGAEVDLGAMPAGEVVTLHISARAATYSVDEDQPVMLRAFVKNIDDHYGAASFGGAVTGDGSQTFGGGRLEIAEGLDVYSHVRWEFESDRREGFTGSGAVAPNAGALELAETSGAYAVTPVLALAGGPDASVSLRARRSAGQGTAALLLFADEAVDLSAASRVPIDLPADGAYHDITVSAAQAPALDGTIRRIGFVPFESGTGPAAIDWLRVEGATPTDLVPLPEDQLAAQEEDGDGCSCAVTGGERGRVPWGAVWLAALGLFRRQRGARRRPVNRRAA